ncbi:uridine kinase [Candidatus Riflebacteria bacterium]
MIRFSKLSYHKRSYNMNIWRKDTKPLVVGIGGISGSGKSTLVDAIFQHFEETYIALLPHDMYYLSREKIPLDHKKRVNHDLPQSLDTAFLIRQIKKLLKGKNIKRPIYDFAVQKRSKKSVLIEPAIIIVVEGILIFAIPELRELFDIKIFIDVPLDIALARRILRDVKERGRTVDNVLAQYYDTVRESALENIIPSKYHADIIIPRGGNNPVALNFLTIRFEEHILKYV